MTNKPQVEELSSLSYEELSKQLSSIIEDFQKGNLMLTDAVSKYNRCVQLIQACQSRIDYVKQESAQPFEQEIADIKMIDFEKNMIELESMKNRMTEVVPLEELGEIINKSRRLSAECRKVLDSSENLVEYKSIQ